jgi:hypothetical protein
MKGIPRRYVAATNPARSPTTPTTIDETTVGKYEQREEGDESEGKR